ncbi:MAG: hypothetical protein O3A78_13205 [Nitrospinae bacterium]|jgi:hypothetical protein|nr:hypothetical protein [Nitrospinota bacterium]
MVKVKIKDLQEGMILADNVRDQNGMLIVSQGQSISEKHLRTFKSWGITEIDIVESMGEKDEADPPEKKEGNVSAGVKEQVDELFRYTNKQHPAIAELMELCILRKTESL